MIKIDIFSGFLGAGKTTLIKKLLSEYFNGEKIVLIENEFGEIGIDGGFLKEAGINITEMNSGCICCSLVGDFGKAMTQVIAEYSPDRIIIEPSGVGKLSDVVAAVNKLEEQNVMIETCTTVVDATKVKVYSKNFGEFYNNQIESASAIILSRTSGMDQHKLENAVALLREHNDHAAIITTPWDELSAEQIVAAMEGKTSLEKDISEMIHEHIHEHHDGCCCGSHHEHHHHEHEEHHCCGHHHDEQEEHHCCGHHHDEHEDHHCCGHHHDELEEHHCCGHDHDHHHHHHADEVFTSWGCETIRKFTEAEIKNALAVLDTQKYGTVLRAKGIVPSADGKWIHFDYVPEEINVRNGAAEVTGKICVIGSQLNEQGIAQLFVL